MFDGKMLRRHRNAHPQHRPANSPFADAEPEPLTFANLTTKSLTCGLVDDFASQKDAVVRKLRDRLIGILDRALHAVTEAELHREEKRQASGFEAEAVCPHQIDDLAAIVFLQLRTNFRAESKSFLKVCLVHPVARSGL